MNENNANLTAVEIVFMYLFLLVLKVDQAR